MIVRERPGFLSLFFIMRGSVVPRILPHLIGIVLYASAVVLIVDALRLDMHAFNIAPFALLGVTISIYLSFRNNAAYDRWWEARKLWGQLIFEIRNLSRATIGLVPEVHDQRAMLMRALAFCHLLRGQLRGVDATEQARAFVGGEIEQIRQRANPADEAIRIMGGVIGDLRRAAVLDPIGYRILDERLCSLSALQAGCERIATTPLPFAYTLLLQRTAYVFCLLLPFGLVPVAGWGTPLLTAIVAYTYFGLDALSAEMEDPFGLQANDLALDAMCRICEISVADALGDPVPAPIAPTRYKLT